MSRQGKGIIITGFMGTGKTSVGKRLADLLNMDFFDLDEMVEKRMGMSVRDIFERFGEDAFREVESDLLEELVGVEGRVIATGGGAVLREKNRKLMKEYGKVVNLVASVGEIERRVSGNSDRPLLSGCEVREKIRSLMDERERYYAEADLRVITDGKDVDAVVNEIIDQMGGGRDT